MRSLLISCALLAGAMAAHAADELHMRDGTVIVGSYVGGTQKEVYFQRTAAGTDMYSLFMVESVKFNCTPALEPGVNNSLRAPSVKPPVQFTRPPIQFAQAWASQLKWALALLFPPPLAAQLSHPAH